MDTDRRGTREAGSAADAGAARLDAQTAAEHLAVIRRIMDSATQLTVLPGRAAIIGGALALAGCVGTYALTQSFDFNSLRLLSEKRQAALVAMWAVIAILGVAIDVTMTVRLARRRGVSPWSRLAQLAAYAMGPCLLAALLLTVALIRLGEWGLVPAVWLMLYGGAVWMASILSVRAPSILGAVFFVAGILALFWVSAFGLALVALTFGVAHIVFGLYLLKRFGA